MHWMQLVCVYVCLKHNIAVQQNLAHLVVKLSDFKKPAFYN